MKKPKRRDMFGEYSEEKPKYSPVQDFNFQIPSRKLEARRRMQEKCTHDKFIVTCASCGKVLGSDKINNIPEHCKPAETMI